MDATELLRRAQVGEDIRSLEAVAGRLAGYPGTYSHALDLRALIARLVDHLEGKAARKPEQTYVRVSTPDAPNIFEEVFGRARCGRIWKENFPGGYRNWMCNRERGHPDPCNGRVYSKRMR